MADSNYRVPNFQNIPRKPAIQWRREQDPHNENLWWRVAHGALEYCFNRRSAFTSKLQQAAYDRAWLTDELLTWTPYRLMEPYRIKETTERVVLWTALMLNPEAELASP